MREATRIRGAIESFGDGSGWEKGGGGRRCVLYEMGFRYFDGSVSYHEAEADPEVAELAQIIREQYPDRIGTAHLSLRHTASPVWLWNDSPHTVSYIDDVLPILEKGALRYEEKI